MTKIDPREQAKLISARIANMTVEERAELNARATAESEQEHDEFRAAFQSGRCYLCERALDDFAPKLPCLHWLLRPLGVKKPHIREALTESGAMTAQTFLRWIASEEAPVVNINDLPDGSDNPKPIEVSIRYKDLEWSFSCGRSDLEGHGASHSTFPHYHFQMRIKGRPFIGYNDFHLPLKREETAFLHARLEDPRVALKFPRGWGMADVLHEENLKKIIDLPVGEADAVSAPFHMSTMVYADEGTQISGDALADMIERARKERRSIASLARELPNVSVATAIGPGPGVVEIAEREGGRGRKVKGS